MIYFLFFLFSITLVSTHEIKNLPGLDYELNFKQYAGFLNVQNSERLFYWFVESQKDVTKDPLIFWFNGGPGCSSLAGLLEEHGPFLINNDAQTVRKNEYSWNKLASVVYLEAPLGVGFSQTKNASYKFNDDDTASRNYEAIKQFLTIYPQFRLNDIYLAGESYAGVYVPMLAGRIIDGQKEFQMNLKGLVIGNGFVSLRLSLETSLVYAYTHGMVDEDKFNRLVDNCCDGTIEDCDFFKGNNTDCQEIINHGLELPYPELNLYDINEECEDNSWIYTIVHGYKTRSTHKGCIDFHENSEIYLNRQDVWEALQIPSDYNRWKMCNDEYLEYEKEDYPFTKNEMDDLVKKAAQNGVRTLLFYGDADLVCNFMMGQTFAGRLGLKEIEPYRPWLFDGIVAGFRIDYSNLTYLTVREGGHSSAVTHPKEMFDVIEDFLKERIPPVNVL